MDFHLTINSIPIFIFFARICDVSLGTMRIIFVSKGKRIAAACLGFIEILIWIAAIGVVMKNLNNAASYIAYAGGFACGTFAGIFIEEKLAIGIFLMQIIVTKDLDKIVDLFKRNRYGVTLISGKGRYNPVDIIYVVLKRSDISHVLELMRNECPNVFYTVQDIRLTSSRVFSPGTSLSGRIMRRIRKSK